VVVTERVRRQAFVGPNRRGRFRWGTPRPYRDGYCLATNRRTLERPKRRKAFWGRICVIAP
jgi:hypothetical protein